MTRFYLLRHEDIHGNSGNGIVAEGAIFDNGMVAMTWLTDTPTMTMFRKITDVIKLHSHEGRTEVVIEGRKKHRKLFEQCQETVRTALNKKKQEAE